MVGIEFQDYEEVVGDLVKVSRRVRAPAGFEHGIRGGRYPSSDLLANIVIRAEWVPDKSRFDIAKLEVSPMPHAEPISSQLIRKIPVASLLEHAVGIHLFVYGLFSAAPDDRGQVVAEVLDSIRENAYHLRESGPSSPDLLEGVSVVYEVASVAGNKPTQEVSRVFGVSLRTASNWVRAAREAGAIADG